MKTQTYVCRRRISMNRIENLRLAALHHPFDNSEFYYRFFRRHEASTIAEDDLKYADAFYEAFSHLTPTISDGELIVGKTVSCLTDTERQEWQNTYRHVAAESAAAAGGGQDSHMAVDYELLLNEGILGIIRRIDTLAADCTPEQSVFYSACRTCLLAVIAYSGNYALLAGRLASEENDPVRREELLSLAEICRKVPAHPAETFHEAVQSVHFITHCLTLNPRRFCSQQFQLGHPDRYLLPFYRKDLEEGRITKERAQLLLDCLGIQINNRVPHGLSSGYMVGGRDTDGNVVANELTEMCMRVIDDIRLVYPSVGYCHTSDTPERYLRIACEILSRGRSHPAIFNDDIITEGLMRYGVPEREAHNYIHSTCVEITPAASSNVWVASPYTNMPGLLLETMDREYASFDEHLTAVFALLDTRIRRNFEAENANRKHRAEHAFNPLLSCFVNDCLARGLDIERGGARYNWIMPSFVGMANLTDSLFALKTLIYDTGEFTVSEFRKILDADFEGSEPLRKRILDRIPKYGNDNDEVDRYFRLFTDHIVSECRKYRGLHTNGNLIPSVFCWIMHERFGSVTGATPDGRKAGFPLGDGSGPCQGRERNGPTASLLSSTKWDHRDLIGGV
ncbi:MAG: hypothetical protein E7658_10410, partial [Ruminococcaceae bacterium]|nr:hypothetical protein [Oscillospiraceae bacterium]